MKFSCVCGFTIKDGTDFQNHKAHLVSDQDICDAAEISDNGSGDWWPLLTRSVYQCKECQRLWINSEGGELLSFAAESSCPNILSSIHGDRWKRILLGEWADDPILKSGPKGFLNWKHLSDEDYLTFEEWSELESNYFRILESLQENGLLRTALLKKNSRLVHQWPQDD